MKQDLRGQYRVPSENDAINGRDIWFRCWPSISLPLFIQPVSWKALAWFAVSSATVIAILAVGGATGVDVRITLGALGVELVVALVIMMRHAV